MTRFSFSSLRVRLLLLVLLSVVPALGVVLYQAYEERRLEKAQAQEDALRLARIAAGEQERLIEGGRQFLDLLAQLPPVRGGDRSACSGLSADLLRRYPRYANLGAIGPHGDVYCSALPFKQPVNVADRAWFQNAVRTRDFAVGEYQIGRITGKATVNFGYPVLDEAGKVQAVVFAALDLVWLSRFVAEAQLPKGLTLTVIDRNGTVLARNPDPEKWVGQPASEASIVKIILAQGEGTAEALGLDDVPRLYGFTRVRGALEPGHVAISIGIPTETVFAEVDRTFRRNLALLGIVALLALAAAWFGGDQFIRRPVHVLVSATKRLAAGDLSARTGLPYGPGELSHLARSFDEMAEDLQARRAEAERAEEELRRYAQRLKILHEIDRAILAAQSPEAIAEAALRQVRQLVPCRQVSVVVFDFQTGEGVVVACLVNGATQIGEGARFPLQALGIAEELRQGQVHRVDDILTLSEPPPIVQALHAEGLRSYISVPLVSQGELIGSLNLGADSPGTFGPEPVDIAREVADQLAVAVQQARLHEEVQRHAADLEQKVQERTKELGEANARLQEASRHKSEFLANMSHELRTPLNAVIGFSEFLQQQTVGPLTAKQARYVGHIQQSGKHLLQLINDILDLSKVEAGKFVLEPQALPVATTLEDILVIARGLAHQKAQSIELEIEPDLPPLQADPVRFKQILFNLLSNAVKFTPEQGQITLVARRASAGGELLELRVTDTGIGIKAEDLPRLFQEFVQLEAAATKRYEGTGLGLALTKRLVELHGGRISAASEGEGRGTTFTVVLPFQG